MSWEQPCPEATQLLLLIMSASKTALNAVKFSSDISALCAVFGMSARPLAMQSSFQVTSLRYVLCSACQQGYY